MKKALLFLSFTLLFVTACKKAETTDLGTGDDTYLQQVDVTVNNGGLGTRSTATAVIRPRLIIEVGVPNRTITYVCSGNSAVTVRWTTDAANAMTFSSTQAFNAILGCNSASQRAHHLVPLQTVDEESTIGLHPVLRAAALNGFHPQDSYNGICIPTALHANHPQYNTWVVAQLNAYAGSNTIDFTNIGSCNKANLWVQCTLIPELRRLVNLAVASNTVINEYFRNLPVTNIGY